MATSLDGRKITVDESALGIITGTAEALAAGNGIMNAAALYSSVAGMKSFNQQGNAEGGTGDKGGLNTKPQFASEEKLISHYEKHGSEFKGLFNSADEYLEGAQDVMQNGYKVEYYYKGETRTGFVQFIGNNSKGEAKFAFVGTNNEGYITTFHTESGKTFWKMLNGANIQIINPK